MFTLNGTNYTLVNRPAKINELVLSKITLSDNCPDGTLFEVYSRIDELNAIYVRPTCYTEDDKNPEECLWLKDYDEYDVLEEVKMNA